MFSFQYSGELFHDIDIAISDCNTSTLTVLTISLVLVKLSDSVATSDLLPAQLWFNVNCIVIFCPAT